MMFLYLFSVGRFSVTLLKIKSKFYIKKFDKKS